MSIIMRKMVLLTAFFLVTIGARAETYRWQDAQGHVHYGDDPPKGARALREINTFECVTEQCIAELRQRYEQAVAEQQELTEWLREREAARRRDAPSPPSNMVYVTPQWLPIPYAAYAAPWPRYGHARSWPRYPVSHPARPRAGLANPPQRRLRTRFVR